MNLKYKCSVIYTTLPSLEKSKELAHLAVIGKYARCVNIIPNITSIYEWQGEREDEIEESSEYVVLFKTILEKENQLIEWLMQHHPYETPAILNIKMDTTESFWSYLNGK